MAASSSHIGNPPKEENAPRRSLQQIALDALMKQGIYRLPTDRIATTKETVSTPDDHFKLFRLTAGMRTSGVITRHRTLREEVSLSDERIPPRICQQMLLHAILNDHRDAVKMLLDLSDERIPPRIRQQMLLHAILNDHRDAVEMLLDKEPELLIMAMPMTGRLVLQSHYTWQQFYAEKPLMLAVAGKQVEMVKILKPYFEKLLKKFKGDKEQYDHVVNAINEGIAAFKPYATQTNAQGREELVIPQSYAARIQPLVDVFCEETFPNGHEAGSKLSENTEAELADLLNFLVPEMAVDLAQGTAVDPDLFFYALYKAHNDNFDRFYAGERWDRCEAFGIHVIGLAQSVLSPETAQGFCQGLYLVGDLCQTKTAELGRLMRQFEERVHHRPESGSLPMTCRIS